MERISGVLSEDPEVMEVTLLASITHHELLSDACIIKLNLMIL